MCGQRPALWSTSRALTSDGGPHRTAGRRLRFSERKQSACLQPWGTPRQTRCPDPERSNCLNPMASSEVWQVSQTVGVQVLAVSARILRLSETFLVYRAEARSQTGSARLRVATARHPSPAFMSEGWWTKLESNRTRRRSDNCYAKGARRAGQGRASGEPKCSERTLDAPKRSRKMVGRSDADFALQKNTIDFGRLGFKSDRQIRDSIAPLFGLRGGPDENQRVGRFSDRETLWNDDESWTGLGPCEFPEMGRHCRLVVGDKNALVLRSDGQHGCIVGTPARPAAVAVRKSISGLLRTTAATMI